jgi:hypothetical protein
VSAHCATWGAVVGEARALTLEEEAALELIARLPLVPARHLQTLSGECSSAAAYRRVARLRRGSLVAMVDGPREGSGRRPRLLLVQNLGLAVLAHRREVEPEALARSYGLHRRALDKLCLGLPAALAGYELLALLTHAMGRQARVRSWQRPWRWAVVAGRGDRERGTRTGHLPAYATVDWESRGGRLQAGFVLVADTGGLPPSVLQPQLAQLCRMLSSAGQTGPGVAIATTSERRVNAWLTLMDHLVSNRHDTPVEGRVATWQAWRLGQVAPPRSGLVDEGVPAVTHCTVRTEKQRRLWSSIPRPIGLTRVGASVAVWHMSTGDRAVLDVVGRHPFLPTQRLGEILGKTARWARERRAELVRLGLLRVMPAEELPRGVGGEDALLELTVSGLTRLSASLGLSLATAVRSHGLAGGGPYTPIGPRRALVAYQAHTLGTDAIFAAIAISARRQHGGVLLEWRNAAACARGRMRPDGYGLLCVGRREYGFFLEFDRGTVRPAALRAKFAAYHRYQVSPRADRDYDGFPTIVAVTTGPGAEQRIVDAVRAAAAGHVGRSPILVTTLGWINSDAEGPFGAIWLDPHRGGRHRWPGTGQE